MSLTIAHSTRPRTRLDDLQDKLAAANAVAEHLTNERLDMLGTIEKLKGDLLDAKTDRREWEEIANQATLNAAKAIGDFLTTNVAEITAARDSLRVLHNEIDILLVECENPKLKFELSRLLHNTRMAFSRAEAYVLGCEDEMRAAGAPAPEEVRTKMAADRAQAEVEVDMKGKS